tara:strand:- start:5784 stop:6428 length:645 start_codon:yes stop_codon:yes gene_type:complete
MSSTFWINEPNILIDFKQPFIPNNSLSCESNLNAITKLVILTSIFGLIFTESLNYIISGILTILLLIFIYYHTKKKEHYSNLNNKTNGQKYKINNNLKKPTTDNPLMNVSLPEIKSNPTRPPADKSYTPENIELINQNVKQEILTNNDLDSRLFKDLGDELNFDQSMRQFYTTANSTIPNDQNGFMQFCYGDMKSCKENNSVCTGNMPTFNHLS